jgi:hypothetical protein
VRDELRASGQRVIGPVPPRRLAAVVGGALALIAIVAVASRGDVPEGGSGDGQTAGTLLANGVLLALAIVFAGALVLFILSFSLGPASRPGGRPGPSLLAQLVLIAAVMGLIVVWRNHAERQLPPTGPGEVEPAPFAKGPQRDDQQAVESEPPAPAVDWRLIAVAFGGALVAFGVVGALLVRQGKPEAGTPGLARALTQIFDETLDDLRRERDPRKAVIAAYARMEQLLARWGLPRRPADAPHEYVTRVLRELSTSAGPVERLTALYERARFSDHEVGPGMKDEAIAGVEAVRDALAEADVGAAEPVAAT